MPAEHRGDCWSLSQVLLYSQPDFQGKVETFDLNQKVVPEKVLAKSCRLLGGG